MANIEVHLPSLGEGIIEATITRWLTELDSEVIEDEPLVEIATDKVDSEIPSPVSGILKKQFFREGEVPKVGDVIAIIGTLGSDTEEEVLEAPGQKEEATRLEDAQNLPLPDNDEDSQENRKAGHSVITPFIRHYASQRGISFEELLQVKGTGENGNITKMDVRNYFTSEKVIQGEIKQSEKRTVSFKKTVNEDLQPVYHPKEGEELEEMGRMRKLIAEHMVRSVSVAPHVTSTVEVDLTQTVKWRGSIKEKFKGETGVNLTYTSIIAEQVVRALKEYPGINVSLYGNYLVKKKYINLGIATALADNNLIVPVVRNADHLNLKKLALTMDDLIKRARKGGLKPGETEGGTFTITNIGTFNNIMGTPIINQPQSAILAVGTIKKKPWVVELDGALTVGIRDILTLSLSYDHRVIDGALGASFLNRIGQLLEEER